MSTRRAAFEILTRVEREGAWASPLIDDAGPDERDRRFVRTLVMGVLRWRPRLDYVISQLAGRPSNRIDPPFRQILRIGLVQLMYTDVAPHAAVNESVALCAGKLTRGRGMVNAVLRRATRENLHEILPGDDSSESLAVRTGHPGWMIARWIRQFGHGRAAEIAAANQQLSTADLVVNTRRISRVEMESKLSAMGIAASPSPWFDDVLRLGESASGAADLVQQGLGYTMDESSVAVARSFSSLGGTTLDMTAAPGGKTLVMALDGAEIVSSDVSLQRGLTLRAAFHRMFDRRSRFVVADGRQPPFGETFDNVLLDAPCSATGIVRRNPEIRWRLQEKDIEGFAVLQRELLKQAMGLARREIIYSTCSLEREENDQVVDWCMEEDSRWSIAPIDPPSQALAVWKDERCLRITPESAADGFTIHRLVRHPE